MHDTIATIARHLLSSKEYELVVWQHCDYGLRAECEVAAQRGVGGSNAWKH